jgi:hypothetical protein
VSFEIVRRKKFELPAALDENSVSIERSGTVLLRVGPLAMIGVTDQVVALADAELMRVGLRRPTDDETDFAFNVRTLRTKSGRDTGRRHINLTAAIRRLGLEPRDVGGQRLPLMSKDDLLFVTFTDMSAGDRVREAAREKRAARIANEKGGK